MLQAATEGNDTLDRQLLAQGAPGNQRDERGATALMIAARNGDLGMMQALLSRGADPSLTDNQVLTVFGWAEPSPTTAKYVAAFLSDKVSRSSLPARPPPRTVPAGEGQLEHNGGGARADSSGIAFGSHRAAARERRVVAASGVVGEAGPPIRRTTTATTCRATWRRSKRRSKPARPTAWRPRWSRSRKILETKLEHCNLSGGKLGGLVVVRVRTVAGAQESRRWQVFYMPRVFEAAANASPDLFRS